MTATGRENRLSSISDDLGTRALDLCGAVVLLPYQRGGPLESRVYRTRERYYREGQSCYSSRKFG